MRNMLKSRKLSKDADCDEIIANHGIIFYNKYFANNMEPVVCSLCKQTACVCGEGYLSLKEKTSPTKEVSDIVLPQDTENVNSDKDIEENTLEGEDNDTSHYSVCFDLPSD